MECPSLAHLVKVTHGGNERAEVGEGCAAKEQRRRTVDNRLPLERNRQRRPEEGPAQQQAAPRGVQLDLEATTSG